MMAAIGCVMVPVLFSSPNDADQARLFPVACIRLVISVDDIGNPEQFLESPV